MCTEKNENGKDVWSTSTFVLYTQQIKIGIWEAQHKYMYL